MKISIEELLNHLDIKDGRVCESYDIWDYTFKSAEKHGFSKDEAQDKADIAELFVVNEYNVIWLKCLIKTAKTYFGYYDMFIDIQNDIVEILPNKSWVKSASLLVKKEDQCNYAKCSPKKQQDYRWIKIDYLYHQGLSDEQIVEKYLGSVKKYYIFLYEKNKNPATLMEKTLLGK